MKNSNKTTEKTIYENAGMAFEIQCMALEGIEIAAITNW